MNDERTLAAAFVRHTRELDDMYARRVNLRAQLHDIDTSIAEKSKLIATVRRELHDATTDDDTTDDI